MLEWTIGWWLNAVCVRNAISPESVQLICSVYRRLRQAGRSPCRPLHRGRHLVTIWAQSARTTVRRGEIKVCSVFQSGVHLVLFSGSRVASS